MYNLEQLGFDNFWEDERTNSCYSKLETGRISAEHKERYWILSDKGEYEGEITGQMLYTATSRADYPAVGDWVAFTPYDDTKAIIHNIFSRKTIVERQSLNRFGESQIIATNIDIAFIVMAVDRDFNINRAERYIAICNSAKVTPILVCNKIDLISSTELSDISLQLKQRLPSVDVIEISCTKESDIELLKSRINPGKTYCLLGSSGVGKSTILNLLLGNKYMQTNQISSSTSKGKHTTTHRELVILPKGGIIIDNPGMREVGIADTVDGIEQTFNKISALAKSCRFNNCSHVNEAGCAIIEAVKNGTISEESYNNFLKLEREKDHYQASVAEKRQKDKEFGKMVKHFKKQKNKDKEH